MNRNNNFKNVFKLYNLFFVLFCLFFLSFQNFITVAFDLPSYLDEALQVIMLMALIFKSYSDNNSKLVVKAYFVCFIFLFLISFEAYSHRGYSLVIQQVFIHLKFIVFIGYLALIAKEETCLFVFKIVFVVTIVFFAINLFMPLGFNEFFDQRVMIRSDFVRPIGIQGHTGTLGFIIAISSIYFISSNKKLDDISKLIVIILCLFLILLTTVRTGLVVFPILFLWLFKKSFKKFLILTVCLIVLVTSIGKNNYMDELVDITQSNIEMTVDANEPGMSSYIRGIMIYFSFQLANERFPLGTGASTYGTVKSDDSNIYAEIGLHNSRFFLDKDGIYDSNFASLLGEFGYLGVIFYYTFFVVFCVKICSVNNRKTAPEFVFSMILLMLGYSVTNPVFMNTFQIFTFALVFVAAQKYVSNKPKDKEVTCE